MKSDPIEINPSAGCHPAPPDKRKYIGDLGRILVNDYGRKKYYKPDEVKKAHRASQWNAYDFSCWGMSVFSSHDDFDKHHEVTGEICDYTQMKSTMLEGISTSDVASIPSIPTVELDASWLDIGGLLEGVFEGIGEFFLAIADGIDF